MDRSATASTLIEAIQGLTAFAGSLFLPNNHGLGMRMSRLGRFILASSLLTAASVPTAAASNGDRLLRSTGPEVQFRCGSETLRAKLRGGRLVVQTASGERAMLTPVVEPRAMPQTPAYGDGRLTLYKLRDPQVWALSRTDRPEQPIQHCIPQRRIP